MSSIVVVGQKESLLAVATANLLETDFVTFELSQFADEEALFLLSEQDKLASAHVLLIYQFCFKNKKNDQCFGSINDQISGLLELIDCIKSLGSMKVSLLLPYLPYSRQDKSDYLPYKGGVYTFGKCLKAIMVDQVLSCDLHNVDIIKDFPLKVTNISLTNVWIEVIKNKLIASTGDFCIATPDSGGISRAKMVAESLGLPLIVISKKRIGIDQAQAQSLEGDVTGKKVIIIDDIIDTGRTAASAARLLKSHGAAVIYGCFSHGVFSAGAQELLRKSSIDKIFIADTLTVSSVHLNDFCHVFSISEFISNQMGTLLQ